MGSGSSTSKTKTVPLPDEKISIVPVPPSVTTQPPAEISTLPPSPKNVAANSNSALSRLNEPLPNGWRAGEQITIEEGKQRWAQHHCIAGQADKSAHAERNIKRAPTRVALNVLSVWEDADFDLSPGDVVMGRYKVQGALDPPQRAFEVVDSVDNSACLLKVQPPASASAVLQSLSKHEAIRRHADNNRFFLHCKDAFLAPDTGNWAVVVEQERSTLRSTFFTGSNPSEGVVRKIGQIASAALQALDRLHHACWVHTDISLDSVVLDMNGCWKLAALENAKAVPKGGGGVVARSAANRRIRPPEVLVGYPADEKSDVFDLGIALFEAATGTQVMQPMKGSNPGLLQEIDACIDLLGALPQELVENSPEKELICTPDGGFLRTVKRGSREVLEVVRPDAAKGRSGSVIYKLEQGRLAGNSAQLRELRAFLQRLLQVNPTQRPTAAEALNDNFLTNLAAGGKMKRASISGGNVAASSKVFAPASSVGALVEDDEELQKLLKEGEGLLSSTGGNSSASKDSDEPDEPIDTKRRLSYAKIDIVSHPAAAGASKVKFSKRGDDVHHVHSTLTMLPGTVEDEAEQEAEEEVEQKPAKIKRQQTGYVNAMVLEDDEDEESEEEEKQVTFDAVEASPARKIKRQQTAFAGPTLGDDDEDEIE